MASFCSSILKRLEALSASLLSAVFLLLLILPFATHAENQARSPKEEPIRIEIWKKQRTLKILKGQTILAKFPIGLGFNPVDRKTHQGDGATPEGSYEVCIKNPYSQYYLSVGINYPNPDDAIEGLEENIINQAEKELVLQTHSRGECPPWNTNLGGEIFIHGRGSGEDWTLGCVALDDENMKSLFDWVQIGTKVSIYP